MPSPGAYQEAMQFPDAAFADPDLRAAVPEEDVLGLPKAVTGAFAVVFPVMHRGQRWAVKCFLADVRGQEARYRAVSRHLDRHPLPWLVGFDYQPEGIVVEGRGLPVLKMPWVDGTPLNRFVAAHLDRPDVLDGLAAQWKRMLRDLAAAGVAHGDLQHGNVLVVRDGGGWTLRLVDYDTAYVPALRGRRSPEIGHRNYQHPDRGEDHFGPYLDHFAGLVVYTALRACAVRPGLWDAYDTGENLLFRASDFYDPAQSPLFEALAGEAALRPLVEALRAACLLEPEAVPPLAAVLGGTAPTVRRTRRRPERQAGEGRRDAFERLFAPGAGLGLAAGLGLLLAGYETGGLSLLAVVVAAAVGASLYRYHRHPAVRRRRRLGREAAYYERMAGRLRRQAAALEHERLAFVAGRAALAAQRLHEVQEAALAARLKHHFIGEAGGVDGVTHRVVVRLKAAGIRTAFQATPERVAAVGNLSDHARAGVARWREGLAARYAAEVPAALSPAEERRLERYTRQRLDALDAEAARLREKIDARQAERADVERRRAEVPAFTYARYLGHLLRLSALPPAPAPDRPPPALSPAPATPAASPPPSSAEDRPWWRD